MVEIFKLHRLYSLPVYRSRHPGLNEYITGLLSAIRTELAESKLKAITLIISSSSAQDGDGLPLEKYVFEVDFILSHIRRTDRDLSIRDNLSFREIGLYFKAFLMKLSVLDAALEQVPLESREDLTFAVVLEMRNGHRPGPQGADPNQPMEGPWVPADIQPSHDLESGRGDSSEGQLRAQRRTEHPVSDGDGIILPVKSLDSGVINVSQVGQRRFKYLTSNPFTPQLMLFVEDNPARKASLRARTAGGATQRQTTTAAAAAGHSGQGQVDHLHLDTDRRGTAQGDIADIEDALSRDAQGHKARNTRRLRKRMHRPAMTGMGDDNAADADDDAHIDDNDDDEVDASSSSDDGASSSDGTRSDASIQSVGDFAGYGGAGAGYGGAGMTSGL